MKMGAKPDYVLRWGSEWEGVKPTNVTSPPQKKTVQRGSTVRAPRLRYVSPRLTELAALAGSTCGATHFCVTLLCGFLCKSDSCVGLMGVNQNMSKNTVWGGVGRGGGVRKQIHVIRNGERAGGIWA